MVDVGTAVATLKTLATVLKEAGKIDLTQQVIELQQTLLGLLAANTDLATTNQDYRAKISELITALDMKAAFYFAQNAYWSGQPWARDGPFCSRCFDVDQKAVRLTLNSPAVGVCPHCKHGVRLDAPSDQPAAPRRLPGRPGWVNDW
jgi:hypothetical protein